MTESQQQLINILLVEDTLDDIMIAQRAMKDARITNKLWIVRDGQEALDFLEHKGKYQDVSASPKPGLILLDLNMPKVTGHEVLKKIKEDEHLKNIPTVILTVSKKEEDVVKGYQSGCNSFVQKPIEFEKFVDVVKQIGLYWGLLNVPSANG